MTVKSKQQLKLMRFFSTLAGPIQKLPKDNDYQVAFMTVADRDRRLYRYWAHIISYGALILAIAFGIVLFWPSHWIVRIHPNSSTHIENWIMLGCLALLQIFLLIGTLSATRSTLKARDPVPVRPLKHLRVAFATTRAPGEPIAMVQNTLQAAKQVQYIGGRVDVWLLDETNDRSLQAICRMLNVRYFSRAGISKWNTIQATHPILKRIGLAVLWLVTFGYKSTAQKQPADPFYAARSKHGNFNAWREYLKQQGISYDILAGVDTDQVPEPNYLERLLGYFRDPDVAYVVGPQVYGNYRPNLRGLLARWAESQASFFQSTIQRAGNASHSAMFVGTNYAVRMPVLDQIGGFQPCITEDMATGLAIHAQRNPASGNRWKSIYTPDVLAIGEGPDFWSSYFTQQWRWAAGTFDTWRRSVWRLFFKLSPGAKLHYFLMLTFYPMAALTWLLAVTSSLVYLISGATAIMAPWGQFVSLYMMTVVMQLSLYFWNRRYNVSPHELGGSYGVPGMALSSLTAPIYLSALIGVTLGKKTNFVVTKKGVTDNLDWISSFRCHLQWAFIIVVGLAYGLHHGRAHPAMLLWAAVLLIICITPFALGMAVAIPDRMHKFKFRKRLVVGEANNA